MRKPDVTAKKIAEKRLDKRSAFRGFTLIELIIVVIIIGVLAAIAAPMMQGNIKKAIKSEAVAAMGAIRSAERMYYVEYGWWVTVSNTSWDNGPLVSYIRATDLNGRYFISNCYYVFTVPPIWIINCQSNYSGKSESNTLGNIVMRVNDGLIANYN